MSILGNFFSEFYGVFLFPWILILFLRKDRLEILTSLLLILYPVLESAGGPKILTTVYNPCILILVGILVYKQKKNPWFIFLFLAGVLVTALMPFSQLMPNFNQVFLLVVYPASLLLSVYLLSVLLKDGGPKVLTGFLIVVCLGNLILNFKESMNRRIPVLPSLDYESKVRMIVSQPDELALMGIYDSRVESMLFINQYLIGEEIQWINDKVFPVFLKLPYEKADSSVFQLNAREIQPFGQFLRTIPAEWPEDHKSSLFCIKYKIQYLLVKDYDFPQIPETRGLYSDSLHNDQAKYWIFYKK
jgi:hypothetical protein